MKISSNDLKTIRRVSVKEAKRYSSAPLFAIFVGVRYNTAKGKEYKVSMNIALISDDPDFSDTDLFDNTVRFSELRGNDLEITADGRAIYDLWIYEQQIGEKDHGDLVCNTQAYFRNGELIRVNADADVIWKVKETAQ